MRWSVLTDLNGPVLRYAPEDRDGRPIADLAAVVAGRAAEDAATAALTRMRGWLLASEDLSLTAALIKAGARPRRHAFVMQWQASTPLATESADKVDDVLATSWQTTALPSDPRSALWDAILPSWRDAYPSDHPDHFTGSDAAAIAFLQRLLDGSELGPLHRSTTLLVRDGAVLAGDRKSTRLNSSHSQQSRMPSSA